MALTIFAFIFMAFFVAVPAIVTHYKTWVASVRRYMGWHPLRRASDKAGAFGNAETTEQLCSLIVKESMFRRHSDRDLLSQVQHAAEQRRRVA